MRNKQTFFRTLKNFNLYVTFRIETIQYYRVRLKLLNKTNRIWYNTVIPNFTEKELLQNTINQRIEYYSNMTTKKAIHILRKKQIQLKKLDGTENFLC